MAQPASASLVKQLETLWSGGAIAGLTDRQLLEQFNAGRDPARQAAFTAPMRRHGPMVMGLCCKLLHDKHHAEDAFQAVFLVLARRARRFVTRTFWRTGSTAFRYGQRGTRSHD